MMALNQLDNTENELVKKIIEHNIATIPKPYNPPWGSQVFGRAQHRKHHGCVRARFIVQREIPEPLRQGVFKDLGKTYEAWVRFSSGRQQDDRKPDAHGMAIKLLDVQGRRPPDQEGQTSQDFVLVDDELFFSGNLREYEEVNRLIAEGTDSPFAALSSRLAQLITALRLKGLSDGDVLDAIRDFAGQTPATPLSTHYWSTTPYRLGDQVVKYMAVSPRAREQRPADIGENYLADTLVRDLGHSAASFDFIVHVQSSEELHPIDDPTVSWSGNGALSAKLATIEIGQQTVEPASERAERIVFSPWNCLVEHEPCGKINLSRKDVYTELSSTRHNSPAQRSPAQRNLWLNNP
jgi:hypothetical protein